MSVVLSSHTKVEELLLVHMQGIVHSTDKRVGMIAQDEQNYYIKKTEEVIKVNKLKINNQCLDSVNPVILSQIKKSNYPFL